MANQLRRFPLVFVALLTVASWVLAGEETPPEIQSLLERLEDASLEEVESLATEVASMSLLPEDSATATLIDHLAIAWYRHERYPEALALFERLARDQPQAASLTHLKIAQIHRDRGDLEREIESLLASIRHPSLDTSASIMDADNTSNIAHRRLAWIHEERGEWTRALVFWERWEPRSWCGNEYVAYLHQRELGMARCRFHLHDEAEALAAIWKIVADRDGLNGPNPYAAFLFAELSAKAGRLDRARRAVRRLPSDRRDRFLVSIQVAGGFADGSAKTMLDALAFFGVHELEDLEYHVPVEVRGTARLLSELGPAARVELDSRVRTGEASAIAVAAISGNRELLSALRSLVELDDLDPRRSEMVRTAIAILDGADR